MKSNNMGNYEVEGQMDIFSYIEDPGEGKNFFATVKPIRLIELFSGIGSQAMALRDLGITFEHYRTSEWDVNAILSYYAIHFSDDKTDYSDGLSFNEVVSRLDRWSISADGKSPLAMEKIRKKGEKWCRKIFNAIIATHDIGSVSNATGEDLGIEDKDKYTYLLTYSFPCFTGDTLVLTADGYKCIKDVKAGDSVLTHAGRYQLVTDHKMTGVKPTYKVRTLASDGFRCTANHLFYARKMYRTYPTYADGRRGAVRHFKEPEWVSCDKLTKDYYLGMPINQNAIPCKWGGIDFEWSDGRSARHINELSGLVNTEDFWYVVGRWLGDGWCRSQGGIIICANDGEVDELADRISRCWFSHCIVKERTVSKIHIPLKELGAFCSQFGHGAMGKHIPGFVFDLPTNLVKSLVDGYIDSDGCYLENINTYKATSISRELIYGMSQLVAKAYKTPVRLYYTKRKHKVVIEGRECNQNDSYSMAFKKEACKQDKAFYEDGYIWYPIRGIEATGIEEEVYDITVDEDSSFVAGNAIAHNCTDLSLAGKMKGMERGSETSSSLLWQVERLLREAEEKPDILLMENVIQVHAAKNIKLFEEWLGILKEMGYSSTWFDINAKDMGVPQNRDRCFCVSFLGDYDYEPPKTMELTKCMADLLEAETPEEYYINGDRARNLINNLIVEGKIPSIDSFRKGVASTDSGDEQ